jgi:hypothetical protein
MNDIGEFIGTIIGTIIVVSFLVAAAKILFWAAVYGSILLYCLIF